MKAGKFSFERMLIAGGVLFIVILFSFTFYLFKNAEPVHLIDKDSEGKSEQTETLD
ncbi:hypothetical protein LGQ02_03960 [Bacillus shivajii]|uniref:hypothetical protein n=1 Tax=Bacillus shivajii TaxID=1983719 RepID=UPI001CFB0B41|nr:hypothetical protein [Bacillus shivajii]UCZ53947.1 hypothetical protein LGQ02_03960 [Bacillus shivajii]